MLQNSSFARGQGLPSWGRKEDIYMKCDGIALKALILFAPWVFGSPAGRMEDITHYFYAQKADYCRRPNS